MFGGGVGKCLGRQGALQFRKDMQRYLGLSKLPQTRENESLAVGDGELHLDLDMRAHSVRLLELTPP